MTGVEIAMGVAAISSAAIGAAGAIQQSNAANAAAKFNAQMADREAQIRQQNAKVQEERFRREFERLQGRARAQIGMSGVSSTEGSPLDILEMNAMEAELDALTIRHNASLSAESLTLSGALQRMQGRAAKQAGMFNAAGALVGGAAQTGLIGSGNAGIGKGLSGINNFDKAQMVP
jgi:hypothetical protein